MTRSITELDPLQAAMTMDYARLAREAAVCDLLIHAALQNEWAARREWTEWDRRDRIDVLAVAQSNSGVAIFEAKKAFVRSDFQDNLEQTTGYADNWKEYYLNFAAKHLTGERSPAYRSHVRGVVMGGIASTDVMLVCPGFDEDRYDYHANKAAEQGVLIVTVEDAIRYLQGDTFASVPRERYEIYNSAKAVIVQPYLGRAMLL